MPRAWGARCCPTCRVSYSRPASITSAYALQQADTRTKLLRPVIAAGKEKTKPQCGHRQMTPDGAFQGAEKTQAGKNCQHYKYRCTDPQAVHFGQQPGLLILKHPENKGHDRQPERYGKHRPQDNAQQHGKWAEIKVFRVCGHDFAIIERVANPPERGFYWNIQNVTVTTCRASKYF